MVDRVPRPPTERGVRGGVAYGLFSPAGEPRGAVMVLHGAGSVKENHYPFARACAAARLAALVVDLPGHGDTDGALDDRVLERVAGAARVLPPGLPLAVRGSSLGGYLALVGAGPLGATAVAAVCPAPADGLVRSLRAGRLDARIDAPALEHFLVRHDDLVEAARLRAALLLLHADGDEVVGVQHSRALLAASGGPAATRRLIAVPGGHHRSVQRDDELTGVTVRWLARALRSS